MKSGKIKRTLVAAFALCLLAASCAHAEAIIENAVVPLPTQPAIIGGADGLTAIMIAEPTPNPYALSDPTEGNDSSFPMQYPALTDEEAARVPDLLQRYDAGERATQPGVLDAGEAVRLGVYALPAEQYEGERAFLILPGEPLTDDDLLAIIEAYDQLGLRFDPAGVTWRCCMRGGDREATRALTREEATRLTAIQEKVTRSLIAPSSSGTPLPGDDGVGEIALDDAYFSGLPSFRFTPARALSDDELLSSLALSTAPIDAAPGELAGWEAALFAHLHDIMGMPYSAARGHEGVDTREVAPGQTVRVYSMQCATQDGRYSYNGSISTEDGTLVQAQLRNEALIKYDTGVLGNPFDARYDNIARACVASLNPGAQIASATLLGDRGINVMTCAAVHVELTDGDCYHIYVDYATQTVPFAEYYAGEICAAATQSWLNWLKEE